MEEKVSFNIKVTVHCGRKSGQELKSRNMKAGTEAET